MKTELLSTLAAGRVPNYGRFINLKFYLYYNKGKNSTNNQGTPADKI